MFWPLFSVNIADSEDGCFWKRRHVFIWICAFTLVFLRNNCRLDSNIHHRLSIFWLRRLIESCIMGASSSHSSRIIWIADSPDHDNDVTFVTATGELTIDLRPAQQSQIKAPAPPPSKRHAVSKSVVCAAQSAQCFFLRKYPQQECRVRILSRQVFDLEQCTSASLTATE